MNSAPLHDKYILIVETMLPHPLYLDVHYSKNWVAQKRTQVLRGTVARMILQKGSSCIVAIFWVQVASVLVRHGAACI